MKKYLVGLAAALGTSVVCSSAFAVTEYDPFDMKAILAKAEDKALESGKSVLADFGKALLGAIANSYTPGLGAMLGLTSKENDGTEKILAAIEADGNRTRDLISDFWDWAIITNSLSMDSSFDAVESGIYDWNGNDPSTRIANRDQLGDLVSDCKAVLSSFKSGVSPLDRVHHLHAYVTLLNLTIVLDAELAELNYVGGLWTTDGGGNLSLWWAGKTQGERDAIAAAIADRRQASVSGLLRSGLGISFEDYLSSMDAQSDFVAARDQQFSALSDNSCSGSICGSPVLTYFVGDDPQGNCVNTAKCKMFSIRLRTSSNTCAGGLSSYFVDFVDGPQCFLNATAAYDTHKALILKDMVLRGYGPVRAIAEKWWDTWGFGWRNRIGLDDTIDGYVDTTSATYGTIDRLENMQTQNGMTVGEKGYLHGFALAEGLGAVNAISGAAQMNPDWLDKSNMITECDGTCYSFNVSRFPSSTHLYAMRNWPMTTDGLYSLYRGLPAAKCTGLQSPLL